MNELVSSAKDLTVKELGSEMAGVQTYELGDWKLQSGKSIPNAQVAYKTFGDPKSPAIIYPSWYSGCELSLASHV